jgi:hypothetical protein
MMEAASAALYPEHYDQAVAEFTSERLRSFYMANRDLSQAPRKALAQARSLVPDHPNAALLLAAVAMEVGLRETILRPVIHGLVHNEALADTVAELVMEMRPTLDRLRQISVRIVAEHGGIDLDNERRPNATQAIWPEMKLLQRRRNKLLHAAVPVSVTDAEDGIAVAAYVLETALPHLLDRLDLNLSDASCLVSRDTGWRLPLGRQYTTEGGRIHGPFAAGQYRVRDDGRIFDELADTGYYVVGNRLYGPTRQTPWEGTGARVSALLKAAREFSAPLEVRTAALKELFLTLFSSLRLNYDPAAGPPDAFGVVVSDAGPMLLGVHLPLARAVPAIRDHQEAALALGTGGLIFGLNHFESETYSLQSRGGKLPTMVVDHQEFDDLVAGRTVFGAVLNEKLRVAREHNRIHHPVRIR